MIKTIISDLGGVFLNRGIWKFWEYTEKEYGIPQDVSKEAFLKYYKLYFSGKITEEEFWKDFLIDTKLNEDWHKLREILLNLFEPNKEVVEVYEQLRENGKKLVLLSDQTKEWWPFLNDKFKIESHFDKTIVSALIGINKPDLKLYEMAVEISKTKPEECLFIDDLKHNLEPAEKMGIKTIFFENPQQLKEKLIEMHLINKN